jgi:predicted negative regulator of RcsB-dependent stress response
MPKHPTSPRVPRPQTEPDDKFILAVERTTLWARQNSRQLLIGAIVLAIAVAAGVYYWQSQRRVEAEAAARLTEIHQTVMTGNVPLAIRDIQTYLGTFGGTRAANEARLILADLLIAQERPAEAIAALGRLPRDLDEPIGLAAAQLLGAAQEALGQHQDAVETYRRVSRNARFEFQRREALADAARVAMDSGQPDLALEFYDRLVDSVEEADPMRGYFEMWRAEARARLAAGTGGAPPAATPVTPAQPEPLADTIPDTLAPIN